MEETKIRMELDRDQQRAVRDCVDLDNRVVAVTGPAGSGKTSIIQNVAEDFVERGVSFAIAAPTGKAARRIKEATGFPATTVHRLLEYPRPDEFDEATGKPLSTTFPRRNGERPLDQQVIIVDEYAMVPWELHYAISNAIRPGACLRIFGDEAQLAPIEKHHARRNFSPFMQLLRSHNAHVLEKIYRQGEGSQVLVAATRVRRGQMPQHAPGAAIIQTPDPIRALNVMLDQGLIRGYNELGRQLISPVRKGPTGTHALNHLLQQRFNPTPDVSIVLPRHAWESSGTVRVAVSDKVVCTENTYDLRDWTERYEEWTDAGRPVASSLIPVPENKMMLNGETGIIRKILYDGALEIDFGDRVVEVPAQVEEFWAKRNRVMPVDYRRNIDLAYALTTHKCQGSEFEHILYLMSAHTWFNLSRRNFYTGITRARLDFVVLADQRSLLRSLSNKG